MPNSPECQPIADAISNLSTQEQNARNALPALTGIDKWKKMQELGTLRQQIAEQQALLADCEKQHAADLATKVVITDLPGNSGPNRIARTWQLTSDGQVVKQTVTVQDGVANLLGILGGARQSFGITIEETDHPTVNGPDFRSGPLPVAVSPNSPDPVARIEIVILDSILITADAITQAAPALPISLSFPAAQVGTLTFSITDLRILVGSGTVSLFASGTASGAPFPFPTTSPFTMSNTLHIAPAFSMAPSTVVEALAGTVPVLSMPGFVGSIVQDLLPLLSSSLVDRAVEPMMSLLNTRILKRVATVLGLPALPSGSVLSIRELVASDEGLTITPVLGAFGTVLSDFLPQAPDAVVRLAALDVQPASIGTGDPAKSVAQGRVNLDAPAPAGGVTIILSCDRTDVIAIDRPTLFIAEGLQVRHVHHNRHRAASYASLPRRRHHPGVSGNSDANGASLHPPGKSGYGGSRCGETRCATAQSAGTFGTAGHCYICRHTDRLLYGCPERFVAQRADVSHLRRAFRSSCAAASGPDSAWDNQLHGSHSPRTDAGHALEKRVQPACRSYDQRGRRRRIQERRSENRARVEVHRGRRRQVEP
jgi:hypothetical protein